MKNRYRGVNDGKEMSKATRQKGNMQEDSRYHFTKMFALFCW